MLPTAKGQTGEILAAHSDFGGPPGRLGAFPPLCWGEGVQDIERAAGFANHHSPAVVGQFPFCTAGPLPLLFPQIWELGRI